MRLFLNVEMVPTSYSLIILKLLTEHLILPNTSSGVRTQSVIQFFLHFYKMLEKNMGGIYLLLWGDTTNVMPILVIFK